MSEPDSTEALARRVYEVTEPFHVVTYFNPGLQDAMADTGLDQMTFYVGARAAPIGEAVPAVVAAAFYNFSPTLIETVWPKAVDAGLAEIDARRYTMLAEQYRDLLADVEPAEIESLAQGFGRIVDELPFEGRTLSAAWAATPTPDEPVLALWRQIAVLREWRGDNHLAELIRHGLTGLEAGAFHEADLPDPTVKRRKMGRQFFRLSREWSDEQWASAIARLTDRGLVEGGPDDHRLTPDGMSLYLDIEAGTDAVTATAFGPETSELLDRFAPLAKTVIKAGILPGTKKM